MSMNRAMSFIRKYLPTAVVADAEQAIISALTDGYRATITPVGWVLQYPQPYDKAEASSIGEYCNKAMRSLAKVVISN